MQGCVDDKVLAPLGSKTVLEYSLEAFQQSGCIDQFHIVCRDENQIETIKRLVDEHKLDLKPITYCLGGRERSDSVRNALNSAPPACQYVFIHDAARPFVSSRSIQALNAAVLKDQAAALAHPVIDTIKRVSQIETHERVHLEDLDRTRLWAMETPQAFAFQPIRDAYEKIVGDQHTITDDCAAASLVGMQVTLVPNDESNPKLTTAADLDYFNWVESRRQ